MARTTTLSPMVATATIVQSAGAAQASAVDSTPISSSVAWPILVDVAASGTMTSTTMTATAPIAPLRLT